MKSKYIKSGAICIYLDQFAVSDIVDKTDTAWIKIGELLHKGVEENKIICPYTIEHLIETSGKGKEASLGNDSLLSTLSKNYFLRSELEIVVNFFLSLNRKWKICEETFLKKSNNNVLSDEKSFFKYDDLRQAFGNIIQEGTQDINMLREANTKRFEAKYFPIITNILKNEYLNKLINRFDIISKGYHYKPEYYDLAGHKFLHWADNVINILTRFYSFSHKEAFFTKFTLEEFGLDVIPILNIRASLESMMACKNIKSNKNHGIDISRISGGFLCSDIMLMDNSKAVDVRELKLDKLYKTKVFSGKKNDKDLLIDNLISIIN